MVPRLTSATLTRAQPTTIGRCHDSCVALWEKFEPYADPEFEELGFEVICPKPGPDVGVMFEGRQIWFETTSPDRGMDGSLDQVPLPPANLRYLR